MMELDKTKSRKVLGRWINDWELDRKLQLDTDDDVADGDGKLDESFADESLNFTGFSNCPGITRDNRYYSTKIGSPKKGEVYCLAPGLCDKTSYRPTFIIVIDPKWGDEYNDTHVLVAPFSYLSEPATNHEYKLQNDWGPWRRVVSCACAFTVNWDNIDGWLEGALSDEECAIIHASFRDVIRGTDSVREVPGCVKNEDWRMRHFCPVPITHSKDPRIEYQDTMIDIANSIQAASLVKAEEVSDVL